MGLAYGMSVLIKSVVAGDATPGASPGHDILVKIKMLKFDASR